MKKHVSIALLLASCSAAQSAIIVTHATVTHVYGGSSYWGLVTNERLNGTPPGNSFNTWDGRAGVTFFAGNQPTGGMRINGWSASNLGLPAPYANPFISTYTPSGTINFTAIDGTITMTAGTATSGYSQGSYRLTQVATGLYREIAVPHGPVDGTGTLDWPAGPGDYVLSFSGSQSSITQMTAPGSTNVTFALTPEPATLVCALGLYVGRRRR